MSRFVNWYSAKLASRPLLTNVISTSALFAIGDTVAQFSNANYTGYDYPRTLRAWIYGGIIFAPIGTKWYPFLSSLKYPATAASPLGSTSHTVKSTLLRVGVDQIGFSPVGISLYFVVMGLMQGKPWPDIKQNWDNNFIPTLLVNWTVWPTFQAINFNLIPVGYRLMAVNVVSIGWNAFLSYRYSQSDNKDGSGDKEDLPKQK